MKNLYDLKKRKELLKQNIADIEEKLSFENPKESLSAITNGLTDQFLTDKIDQEGNHQISLKAGEILSFVTGGVSDNFVKSEINELGEEKLGINTQNLFMSVAENALKLGAASVVTNYAKKNLNHTDWKKKALGIALIYLAPHALKFVREKLEDYQKQETLKSLNKVI